MTEKRRMRKVSVMSGAALDQMGVALNLMGVALDLMGVALDQSRDPDIMNY
jgi:hypothetical protein